MATGWADHVIFVITSKTQIFKIIAADFTFEFINRHVQDPPLTDNLFPIPLVSAFVDRI
jgi:hypothetical protein